MELKLYDTLTRDKRVFTPLDPARVRMYVCGPTVYDFAHIGNARPVIVFDVLFRLLRHIYGVDHVTYVRNVTDVDDKINARAAERGITIQELTKTTYDNFKADVEALGCLEPTTEPRATQHIEEMKTLIERLVKSGNAYVAEDNVLFHVPSMKDYGRLSNRTLDEMIAGARDHLVKRSVRQSAVILHRRYVEQHVVFRDIGIAAFHQRLDQRLHFLDMLGGARLGRRLKTAKRFNIGFEIVVGRLGQFLDRDAALGRARVDLVVDVGDVAHIGDMVDAVDVPQQPEQHVEHDHRPRIADMGKVIDRRPAHIHAHARGIDRGEHPFLARQRIVEPKLHRSTSCASVADCARRRARNGCSPRSI